MTKLDNGIEELAQTLTQHLGIDQQAGHILAEQELTQCLRPSLTMLCGGKERGQFIVIEGNDGSGTSTHAKRLVDSLRKCGRKAIELSAPSPGPVGTMIRHILTGRVTVNETHMDTQLAYLYAADRQDLLYCKDGIVDKLTQGYDVVLTRYLASSFVYQSTTPRNAFLVNHMNAFFPYPDVTYFINVPVDESMRRMSGTRTQDIYENEEKQRKVSAAYKDYFTKREGKMIDGTGTVDEVAQRVWQTHTDLFGTWREND